MNSLASTTLKDFYVPYLHPRAGEAQQIRLGRIFTVFWGVSQTVVALLAQRVPSALEAGLAALSYASGPTVGAFLLGLSSRRATSAVTLVGMLAGLVAPTLVGLLTPLAWIWNVAVGTMTTYFVGQWCSRIRTKRSLWA